MENITNCIARIDSKRYEKIHENATIISYLLLDNFHFPGKFANFLVEKNRENATVPSCLSIDCFFHVEIRLGNLSDFLLQMGFTDNEGKPGNFAEQYNSRREMHLSSLQQKEEEMRQKFVIRVKEKEAELKEAEKEE